MAIITYSELERLAAAGGYEARGRDITRITVAGVHQVHAGLVRRGDAEAQSAMLAVSRLRRWFLHGEGTPPPVRGAGFVHSNREVWMAYTTFEHPALVRGSSRALAELRSYLAMAITPDYDGSLRAKTNPPVSVAAMDGKVLLRSTQGHVPLDLQGAQHVEHWLSATMRPGDRRGVLCLPSSWESEAGGGGGGRRLRRRKR